MCVKKWSPKHYKNLCKMKTAFFGKKRVANASYIVFIFKTKKRKIKDKLIQMYYVLLCFRTNVFSFFDKKN